MREKERCFSVKKKRSPRSLVASAPVVGWAWESCSHLEKRARRTRGERTGALARGARLAVSRRAWR